MAPVKSKTIRRCRVCRSARLTTYLNLGRTPLANSYVRKADLRRPEYREELALQHCPACGLSQLTKVVPPDRMFRNYLYVSSTPRTFRDHCDELARTAKRVAPFRKGDLALDIGSNDGCLLSSFRREGMRIVGVDPAKNLAAEANARKIPTLCAYWSLPAAKTVLRRFGRPQIITSTNVLAHTDDAHAFVRAVKACLAPRGVWVIEMPYLLDFIKKNEFDTAYHEHLSYFGVHAAKKLLGVHHLALFDVDYFPDLHGGTFRLWACRQGQRKIGPSVARFLRREKSFGVRSLATFRRFAARVLANRSRLTELLGAVRRSGQTIWAYGASAKGNTLLNFFDIGDDVVPVVIDDNPKKWGTYAPGSHMRITGIQELSDHRDEVDFVLLLAWNFKKEIIQRCRQAGYRNKFIVPVPRARII